MTKLDCLTLDLTFLSCSFWRQGSLHCAALSATKIVQKSVPEKLSDDLYLPKAVDLSSTVYMLNPGGDLMSTQAAFETFFASQPTWQVEIVPPAHRLQGK